MLHETREATPVSIPVTSVELLDHWQGHRRLTRRVIEAFPEEALFDYSIGGMRTFAQLAEEMLTLGEGIKGIATGEWNRADEMSHHTGKALFFTRAQLLQKWDDLTATIDHYWVQIPPQRFQETDKAFGQYENHVYATLLYLIDNEVHHRAQGYVYLRSLGIEPPPFWQR